MLMQLVIQWRQGTYNASASLTLPQGGDSHGMHDFLSSLYSSYTALKVLACAACFCSCLLLPCMQMPAPLTASYKPLAGSYSAEVFWIAINPPVACVSALPCFACR